MIPPPSYQYYLFNVNFNYITCRYKGKKDSFNWMISIIFKKLRNAVVSSTYTWLDNVYIIKYDYSSRPISSIYWKDNWQMTHFTRCKQHKPMKWEMFEMNFGKLNFRNEGIHLTINLSTRPDANQSFNQSLNYSSFYILLFRTKGPS